MPETITTLARPIVDFRPLDLPAVSTTLSASSYMVQPTSLVAERRVSHYANLLADLIYAYGENIISGAEFDQAYTWLANQLRDLDVTDIIPNVISYEDWDRATENRIARRGQQLNLDTEAPVVVPDWDPFLGEEEAIMVDTRAYARVTVGPDGDEPGDANDEEAGAYAFANFSRGVFRYNNNTSRLSEELRNEGTRFVRILADNEDYPAALRAAFEFLRSNASRRYTDRTLMAIARAADAAERTPTEQRAFSTTPQPKVYIIEAPFSFDELTEEKRGGTIAVGVVLYDSEDNARGVLAVRESYRRRGIASALIKWGLGFETSFFVSNRNFPALAVAASMNFSPVEIRSNGVVRLSHLDYGLYESPDDDASVQW